MWRFTALVEIFISFCRTKEYKNHKTLYNIRGQLRMPTVHLVKPFIAKSNNFYFSRNNSKYTLNLKENYAKLTSHVFVLWKQLTILNQGNQKEQIFYLKQFIDHF